MDKMKYHAKPMEDLYAKEHIPGSVWEIITGFVASIQLEDRHSFHQFGKSYVRECVKDYEIINH